LLTDSADSSAGSAFIATTFGAIVFVDHSTAGSAHFGIDDGSFLLFLDHSSAGSAFIGNVGGVVAFSDLSSAARATIEASGIIQFTGSSTGGIAQIRLHSNPDDGFLGTLDMSGHNAPGVTIGSLEGFDEFTRVFLGTNNLTIGSNNLSTTFSGVIQDGGQYGGTGGSLTKIGSGTLDLMGANTYTGITNINDGVLQVDGSITSDTFVNPRGALTGSGTVNGNVSNSYAAKVSPGDGLGVPGGLTVTGSYTQAPSGTLVILIGGPNGGQVSVLNVTGNANLNGYLDPVLVNGFVPEIGQSFTFMNYASFTGFFSHIKDQPFDHGRKRWALAYNPTSAVLFVIKSGP
jgi:autotransporter-associated beta strand protein